MKSTSGFGALGIIGIIALLAVLGGIGYVATTGGSGTKALVDPQIEAETKTDIKSADLSDESMMKNETMMAGEDSSVSGEAMMKKDLVAAEPATMMKTEAESTMAKEETPMIKKEGSYGAYDASKLALAKDGGHVVIFFHAAWCPSCRAADADILGKLDTIPAGVHILKADYDQEVALKQKYGVTTQHTFVEVDATGVLVQKWSGGKLAELVAKF